MDITSLNQLKTVTLSTVGGVINLIPDGVAVLSDVVGVAALYSRQGYLAVYADHSLEITKSYCRATANMTGKSAVSKMLRFDELSDARDLTDEETILLVAAQAIVDPLIPLALAWDRKLKLA